jgi:hypothetical protein
MWRVSPRRRTKAGDFAGTTNSKNGYVYITIKRKTYLAHRLAWLYMTGKWPLKDVDHKNRVRQDNSWANLRSASRSQNNANARLAKSNTSGVKGVYWSKRAKKFIAQIKCGHAPVRYIGCFDNIEDAASAYAGEAKRLFGEFAHIA